MNIVCKLTPAHKSYHDDDKRTGGLRENHCRIWYKPCGRAGDIHSLDHVAPVIWEPIFHGNNGESGAVDEPKRYHDAAQHTVVYAHVVCRGVPVPTGWRHQDNTACSPASTAAVWGCGTACSVREIHRRVIYHDANIQLLRGMRCHISGTAFFGGDFHFLKVTRFFCLYLIPIRHSLNIIGF